MTVGSVDAAPTAAPPDESGESAPPDEIGASPELTTAARLNAASATSSEPAMPLLDRPIIYVPPCPTPLFPVPSTGEIPSRQVTPCYAKHWGIIHNSPSRLSHAWRSSSASSGSCQSTSSRHSSSGLANTPARPSYPNQRLRPREEGKG